MLLSVYEKSVFIWLDKSTFLFFEHDSGHNMLYDIEQKGKNYLKDSIRFASAKKLLYNYIEQKGENYPDCSIGL